MKFIILLVTILGFAHYSHANATPCTVTLGEDKFPAIYNHTECLNRIAGQVNEELEASIAYLQMSADFASEHNYRPGLAHFFLESAAEERGHAKKLIEFYLMRGGEMKNITIKAIPLNSNYIHKTSMTEALGAALTLEKKVTKNIRDIIVACEEGKGACADKEDGCVGEDWVKDEDYHTIDFLTGEFLSEQHEGIRKILELLKTRASMSLHFGTLADVIFDQELQKK